MLETRRPKAVVKTGLSMDRQADEECVASIDSMCLCDATCRMEGACLAIGSGT